MQDDSDLMRRVQAGDHASFDRLVDRYRQPLLRAAWSKLGNTAWAEDVVQETFLAVFAARQSYNPQFAFRTWLWTILLNVCKRQWQRHKVRPETSFQATLPTTTYVEPHHHETGLQQVLSTERREVLTKLLTRLPDAQADALRLRFFGELQFSEIAEVMGSSLSGAKTRVKHGLEALAQLMEPIE